MYMFQIQIYVPHKTASGFVIIMCAQIFLRLRKKKTESYQKGNWCILRRALASAITFIITMQF